MEFRKKVRWGGNVRLGVGPELARVCNIIKIYCNLCKGRLDSLTVDLINVRISNMLWSKQEQNDDHRNFKAEVVIGL